jgi:hypothetical protein
MEWHFHDSGGHRWLEHCRSISTATGSTRLDEPLLAF